MIPPEASTFAPKVDGLFWMMCGASFVTMLLVGALVLFFSIKYRRGTNAKRGNVPEKIDREVEIVWTAATAFAFLFFFWFAAVAETAQFEVPKTAMEVHVVAKQWMWKVEHPNGTREIDALHVPVGVPVRLVMTSQDVIHSFYVPAFRMKRDVLPGRYVEAGFKATEPGTFHLFCAEYCGTDHSRMIGSVVVMSQPDYARWSSAQPQGDSLAHQGRILFERMGCTGCHGASAQVRAPDLAGIYGRPQPLAGGGFAVADESYLRDSILLPQQDIVAGYQPIMPSYQGVASEDDLVRLIAYLKSPLTAAARTSAR